MQSNLTPGKKLDGVKKKLSWNSAHIHSYISAYLIKRWNLCRPLDFCQICASGIMEEGNCFWISPAPFTLKINIFVLQDKQSLVSSNLSIYQLSIFTLQSMYYLYFIYFLKGYCVFKILLYILFTVVSRITLIVSSSQAGSIWRWK